MSKINVGDRVKFRAGRGYGEGRVANIAEGVATISTKGGKLVNRIVKMLELVECGNEPASVEPAPTCSTNAL